MWVDTNNKKLKGSIYIFLITLFIQSALDLCCCEGFSLVVVHSPLIVVATIVAEHRLQGAQASAVAAPGLGNCDSQDLEHRLNSTGAWTQLLCSMWNPPESGIEPISPALPGRFFTTEPPGKPKMGQYFDCLTVTDRPDQEANMKKCYCLDVLCVHARVCTVKLTIILPQR